MKNFNLIAIALLISASSLFAQTKEDIEKDTKTENEYRKHTVGASLWMLSAFFPEPADYVLLTYGHHLTAKDRIFVEYNTWKYNEPIGTYNNSDEFYPGYTRCHGLGFGYQRYVWKGAFALGQATPFLKQYMDEDNNKIQNGFQLYLQFSVGYRFEFFNKRVYFAPSWALKYWPVDTNFPEAFAEIEEGSPNHIFEPGLNFGFRF